MRTQLKLVTARRNLATALRGDNQPKQAWGSEFEKAWGELDLLIRANPRSLDLLVERCQLLEDWAQAEPGRWGTAISYWRQLALLLGNARPRPPEYYQAWWHVAFCQRRGGDPAAARRTLKSVLALSSQVMTAQYPEIKKQYDDLLGQLGG